MSDKGSIYSIDDDDDDDDEFEDDEIQWSDLIFLPFHPVFYFMVLVSIVAKTLLGPIQSVYPIVHCSEIMDLNIFLSILKYFYMYFCDIIYFIDTFLHIVHRQVTDTALRREHLPKSAFLLMLDVIALIPFFALVKTEECCPVQLWPNILAFSEFIPIYMVVNYFSLMTTHSPLNLIIGFTLLVVICVNCVTCFFLLLTYQGFCANCRQGVFYDWRKFVQHKLNETNEDYATYVYAYSFVYSFVVNTIFDEIKPSTFLEFVIVIVFMVGGFLVYIFVLFPKLFAESTLNLRNICTFHPHVLKIINETKRRNPSINAYISVKNFYDVMWKKRNGITSIPEIISELPRHLRVDIRQDLVWPVFYHSPILRKTSTAFKRHLCEYIRLDYKLPGEKFFAGPHCHTRLYYLKSGIVQIISNDDGVTPLISVTGGTIFGDISFFVPPLKRKILARCLTYCEVLYISRYDLISAFHKYPGDRYNMIVLARDRIKHAKTLYRCKQHIRGLDRAEDEGVEWVKRRWWEISECVANYKKKAGKKDAQKCELPPEEAIYHCAKYIGQLVLCTDSQLQKQSMFVNVKFPWILIPNSEFGRIWNKIVVTTVLLVLILYPPNITRIKIEGWFIFFQYWTDFVYAADILIAMLTSVTGKENVTTNFATVMFARCKTWGFFLDVLAALWIENIAVIIGKPEYYYTCQFNRLIKIYMLFWSEWEKHNWSIGNDHMLPVYTKIFFANFTYTYIIAYAIYATIRYVPEITTKYFFGKEYCLKDVHSNMTNCENGDLNTFGIAIAHKCEILFNEFLPNVLMDIYIVLIVSSISRIIFIGCKARFVAALYLKYRETINYQTFVTNLKKYYKHHKIHDDLLRRLDRYLICHWKYFKGIDVMHPNLLKDEPYDVYWKVQGEVAEKIISESKAFAGADFALVRELAYAAKFLIIPKNATLFLFGVGCKNVTWIVQGYVKCEYHDESGELLKTYYSPGQMVSVTSVLLGKPSLRTYASCTECEVLYIEINTFFNIVKRYPSEWTYFKTCIEEFGPVFEKMFTAYVKKHREYQKKLRERIFHARQSVNTTKTEVTNRQNVLQRHSIDWDLWTDPESDFLFYWMTFRTAIVVISIVSASLQGGGGAAMRWPLIVIGAICDCIAWADIVVKLFIGYYDENGILIHDKRKCAIHYLTRGFVLDLIGTLPWYEVLKTIITKKIKEGTSLLINTVCKFAHLYILMGYFNYSANIPSVTGGIIQIVKWQLVTLLVTIGASQYLISHCVEFQFDDKANLINMTRLDTCWMPNYMVLDQNPTKHQLYLLFAESINLAQSGLMSMNLGKFKIDRDNIGVGCTLFALGLMFWFVMCYCLTLLVLSSRSDTLFQHGVNQLRKFLTAERVDKKLIDHTVAHFSYWWIRTKGINIHSLMNERIGVVFKQDLSYYFFKNTLVALNTLLHGGEPVERQLASASSQVYFLPSQEIIREMDLAPYVYIVHRGQVIISQDGEILDILTKGGIFGQLNGTTPRPVRVSAVADGYADLLHMPIKQFQENITDEVRENIARNYQSEDDYMATKNRYRESPYNTVKYILRGRKTIQLPWMTKPMEARSGTWYSRWLFITWLISPFASAVIVLLLNTLPLDFRLRICWILILLDIIHLAHTISEFYTLETAVINEKCVDRKLKFRIFKDWTLYVNITSLLIPLMTFATGDWNYQLARLLRLLHLYHFNVHFCRSFKSKASPLLMKFIILFLLLHSMTCGWIYFACREKVFPVPLHDVPPEYNKTIDYDEWTNPRNRQGGCPRMSRNFPLGDKLQISFLVPKDWRADYLVALIFIVLLHTHIILDIVMTLTLTQICYKIVINFFIYLIDLWLMSVAVNAVYTSYRELYQYDYKVMNLCTYLRHSGLSPSLLRSVKKYTNQLWSRQSGNWLPELAQQAPQCLREDLLGALYMHHIQTPPLFRELPMYFKRQLVARAHRIVVFPGRCIVQEGDIFSCIYFIHEGEVEKWYNHTSYDRKMMALLTTNGYFGFIPGLFPNIPFQYSYYARTVVDLVYLRLRDWQYLLNAYPEIKSDLYARARQLKKELAKQKDNIL